METNTLEVVTVEPIVAEQNTNLHELAELQLAFVGGGIGNVIIA